MGPFARMARVLEATARTHCPTWTLDVAVMRSPAVTGGTGVSGHLANTRKLEEWRRIVEAAPDGTCLALLDADTWVQRPLDPVWEQAFDLAYTVRSGWPIAFNLGVLFVRVSPRIRRFWDAWVDENRQMLEQVEARRAWRQRFGGVNQAAFGALLESGALRALDVLELSCREWNCEDSAWAAFDPRVTRIGHLKSQARAMALGDAPTTPALRPLVQAWRQIDLRVNGARRGDA